jgi:hypothetical protein
VNRRTGGIRLYLRPPWYSSGEGELLGVVLADPAQDPPDDLLRPAVTHWGRDPIWVQRDPMAAPAPPDFPAASVSRSQVPLEEMPGQLVTVVGHDVGYDEDRGLVVCDIGIEPTAPSYFPFVRLALARFQPSSIPGAELSRVVLADYVQVAPERTVTAIPHQDLAASSVHIEVTGFTAVPPSTFTPVDGPEISPAEAFLPLIQVEVEDRELGTDPDVGWRAVSADAGTSIHVEVFNQNPTLWRGTVSFPPNSAPGQYRIVIREVEPIGNDAEDDLKKLRIVFADVIIV